MIYNKHYALNLERTLWHSELTLPLVSLLFTKHQARSNAVQIRTPIASGARSRVRRRMRLALRFRGFRVYGYGFRVQGFGLWV